MRSESESIPAAALLCFVLLAGCTSTPDPPDEPKRDYFGEVRSILAANLRAGRTPDPDHVLSRLKRLAPRDPDALLTVLKDEDTLLENFQSQLTEGELRRMGQATGASKSIPILQKVIIDGGDGIFVLAYVHRLRGAKGLTSEIKEAFEGNRGADAVAMDSNLIDGRFIPHRDVFRIETALARLKSPDWRVGLTAPGVLLSDLFRESSSLREAGLAHLAEAAGRGEREAGLLGLLRGDGEKFREIRDEMAELSRNVGRAYMTWFDEGGRDDAWSLLFEEVFEFANAPERTPEERVSACETALRSFGHGSGLSTLTTALGNPRSYVKVLSPRLMDRFRRSMASKGMDGFVSALVLLGGADPYLKARFVGEHRSALVEAVLDGLALAPPALRTLGLLRLEVLTKANFPLFDPFGEPGAREVSLARMKARFSRTGFEGLGEETERRRRIKGARNVLDTIMILQRNHKLEHGRFCADVASLFGSPALVKAAGITEAPEGGWRTRFGFALEMELSPRGFHAVVRGKIWDDEPEASLRIRSDVGLVEMLPS